MSEVAELNAAVKAANKRKQLFEIHLAFAKLEMLELENGMRRLMDCPGIRALAEMAVEDEQLVASLSEGG